MGHCSVEIVRQRHFGVLPVRQFPLYSTYYSLPVANTHASICKYLRSSAEGHRHPGGQHVGDGGAERDATGMMSILGIVGSLACFSFMAGAATGDSRDKLATLADNITSASN